MERLFPFVLPSPLDLYLTLYVCTLVVHILFMSYVLAGSAYVAWTSVFTGGSSGQRHRRPVDHVLRDWLPFVFSAAVTAGVAPLLFVQVLYQRYFYTAHLLLRREWISVLVAVIVGFYLLYLLKSRRMNDWHGLARGIAGVGAFLCFAFTAFTWTHNHLVSLEEGRWAELYVAGPFSVVRWGLVARLATWFTGSVPIMCCGVAWQLRACERGGGSTSRECARLARVALVANFFAALSATSYFLSIDASQRASVTSPLAMPYLTLGGVGVGLQCVAWFCLSRDDRVRSKWLYAATAGALASVVGVTVMREALRLGTLNSEELQAAARGAAQSGGLFAFLFFFAANTAVVTLCMARVLQRLRAEAPSS